MVRHILSFAPLQPSNLQFVSGPDSPASPKSPFGLRARPLSSPDRSGTSLAFSTFYVVPSRLDFPPEPDAWTWKCHQCHSRFALGVTRRCLHDGHYLCSGTREVSRRSGRVKHTKSCSSEFDYAGWREFSKWKRRFNCLKSDRHEESSDQCIYPSECRWNPEARAERLREELEPTVPEPVEVEPTPTFDSILGLPMYGTAVECPEPTVSFAPRADHPGPLSSAATSTTPETKKDISHPAGSEPTADSVQPASDRRKNTRPSLQRLEQSVERRSAMLATLLSPIEEEYGTESNSPTVTEVCRSVLSHSTFLDRCLKSYDSGQEPTEQVSRTVDKAFETIDGDSDDWFAQTLKSYMDIDKDINIATQLVDEIN